MFRACAGTLTLATALTAQAQVLEEVTVTAQKREQNIQDVGISISALSGDTLKTLGLDNTQEISQQIPGLQLQTFTPAFTIFNLRGVSQNNFTDNLEAPVAVYMDDVYVASMNAIGGARIMRARLPAVPACSVSFRNAIVPSTRCAAR